MTEYFTELHGLSAQLIIRETFEAVYYCLMRLNVFVLLLLVLINCRSTLQMIFAVLFSLPLQVVCGHGIL